MKKLSIIVTCLNNENNLSAFYDELFNVLKKVSRKYSSEILFIDNGSTDKTLDIIKDIERIDPRVKYISLIKTVNDSTSIYVGLKNLNVDFICFMNSNQKYSISLIQEMLYALDRNDYDICAIKVRNDNYLLSKLVSLITNNPIEPGTIGCKMITKRTAESILNSTELNNISKGIFNWSDYDVKYIECDSDKDLEIEEEAWNDNLVNYIKESLPLILPTIIGSLMIIPSFCILFVITLRNIVYNCPINKLLFISLLLILIGGINLLLISMLIKYLLKKEKDLNVHPTYVIKEQSSKEK